MVMVALLLPVLIVIMLFGWTPWRTSCSPGTHNGPRPLQENLRNYFDLRQSVRSVAGTSETGT